MRKVLLSTLLLLCSICGFAYDVRVEGYQSVGTYDGYPLYNIPSYVKSITVSSSYGGFHTVYLNDSLMTKDNWGNSYSISMTKFKLGNNKLKLVQYGTESIGYIVINDAPSHRSVTLQIFATSPQHWESSRNDGATWTELPNSASTTYTEADPERGKVLYRILQGDGTYTDILTINYYDVVPSDILALPATSTKTVDESVTFSLDLEDDGYTYQWMHNGTAVEGATQNTYTINEVKAADAGTWHCVVSNPVTIVNSTNIELTVNKCAQTIDFPEIPTKTYGDEDFTLPEKTNKGQTIVYQITNPAVATVSGNIVTIKGCGETNIIASQAGNEDYLAAPTVTRTLTVNKRTQTITFEELPVKTYEDIPFTLTASSNEGLPITYQSINTEVATIDGSTLTIVGAGTTEIIASQAGDATRYAAAPVTRTLTVNKRAQTITMGAFEPRVYGDAPIELNMYTDKNLEIVYTSDNEMVASVSGNIVTIKHPGTATITANQSGTKNYLPAAEVKQTLTVLKATQQITLGDIPNRIYGDADTELPEKTDKGLTIAYASDNEQVATIVRGHYIHIEGVGTANITATQEGDEYYNAAAAVTLPFTVSKAYQTITFPELPTYTYGMPPVTLTATTTSSATVRYESSNTKVATIEGNVMTLTGAGSCYITAYADGDNNYYSATPVQRELVVQKATQDLLFTSVPDKVYGDDPFTLTATSNRDLPITFTSSNPSKISISGNVATIKGAGTVTITAKQEGTTDYEPQTAAITVVVNKAVLQVSADDQQKAYGDENPTLTVTYTGFKNGDTKNELATVPTATCPATVTSPVGEYVITVAEVTDDNYTLQCQKGTLTVTKAPLTVRPDDKAKIYGDQNPTLTLTYSGFKNNETTAVLLNQPTVSTTAKTMSNVGEYPIVVEGGEARNYQLIYEEGILAIKKATLTVKLNDASREYGFDNTYDITYSGFKGDDNVRDLNALPTVMTEATASSSVGIYQMTLEGGYDDNYEFTFTYTSYYDYATLTVTKAPLTITADDKVYAKGSNDFPSFSMTFSGFRNGDTEANIEQWPNIYCSANRNSPVGQYPITLSGGYDNNYSLTLQDGTLTITDNSYITVTVVSCEREYGDANPKFTYTVEGGELYGTPNITCSATAGSPVGSYPIVLSMGSITNSRVTLVNGTLTVTKAPLIVKAEDVTRIQGEQNPEFVITYNGWKLNDNESVLISKPTATTMADANSLVGEYPIVVSGGEAQNYKLLYKNGVLTVIESTGINEVLLNEPVDVYDLQGRKIRYRVTSLNDLPKGVYIIKGKKVVVK